MRVAIYFAPSANAPLARAAALWLGRDAFTGAPTRPPDAAIDPIVAEPARYGFHATLRAPFRLRDGFTFADVGTALARFAVRRSPLVLPAMTLARLGRFFALVPTENSDALEELEGAVLEAFEPFRAPLGDAERRRRRPETLSERQRGYLDRWGYPFVREEFRFHMTLTGSVADADADEIEGRLRERFGSFEGMPLAIDRLALFVEEELSSSFVVIATAPLGEPAGAATPDPERG